MERSVVNNNAKSKVLIPLIAGLPTFCVKGLASQQSYALKLIPPFTWKKAY